MLGQGLGGGTAASSPSCPTAQTLLAEAAVTPFRALEAAPGLGLGCCLQAVPSQCSIRVRGLPPLGV